MKGRAIMKTRIMLMSIISFMLSTLPSQAKEVKMAVVSEDDWIDVRNEKTLDALITKAGKTIDYFFQNGDFELPADRAIIISGGRNSIASELEKYKTRKVKLKGGYMLETYGCFVKLGAGKNRTEVFIKEMDWKGGWYCHRLVMPHGGREIRFQELAEEVKNLNRR